MKSSGYSSLCCLKNSCCHMKRWVESDSPPSIPRTKRRNRTNPCHFLSSTKHKNGTDPFHFSVCTKQTCFPWNIQFVGSSVSARRGECLIIYFNVYCRYWRTFYLLISLSSSATARVSDWIDNQGSDPFRIWRTAPSVVSFLAFMVFAINSGYKLFRQDL